MLRSAVRRLEDIARATNAAIGCRRAPSAEAEQCLERGHGLLPPIVPKDELVQVHLELRATDTVIRPDQPMLEITDRTIRERHDRGGALAQSGSDRLLEGNVPIPCGLETGESAKAVGVDRGSGGDVFLEDDDHRHRREVRQHHHPDATRTVVAPLHGNQDRDRETVLQLSAPFDPWLWTTNPGVIDFDLPVQGLAGGIDHRAAQLVEHHPRGFIATQAELTLEQECGHAALVGRHQVRRPKLQRQRSLRVVKDRAGRQGHLIPACCTLPASVRHDDVGALVGTSRASEPVGPPTGGEVLLTRFFGGELTLKLAHISRKSRARYAPTLLMGAS